MESCTFLMDKFTIVLFGLGIAAIFALIATVCCAALYRSTER